jgi:hypothetical protein
VINHYITKSSFQQLLILLLLTFSLNINTLFNEYALDDGVVLTENTLVAQGLKSIPEILTTDLFHGFKNKDAFSNLTQTRYRPLPLILFAIEYQLFGANAFVSHLLNLFCLLILIILLFKLLNTFLFIDKPQITFISCLLFIVHPIHTEVIANVKSRDEIIAAIFLFASFILFLSCLHKKLFLNTIAGSFLFLCALLSKESVITFLVIFPLILYFFYNLPIKKVIVKTIPLIFVTLIYFIIRMNIQDFVNATPAEVLNSPYLLASQSEAFATKIFVLFKYLKLIFLPYPLSYDYGYNVIPYISFYSANFIISFLVLISLFVYSIQTYSKRNILSFCIIYFFITISPGTNFINDLGSFMAERILFLPSLAYCIAIGYLYSEYNSRLPVLCNSVILVIILVFSIQTISRNRAWKNNEMLALTDVKSFPNSVRANFAASEINLIKANSETDPLKISEHFNLAVKYGEQTIKLYPQFPVAYMNLGSAYFGIGNYFKTADNWMRASQIMHGEQRTKYFLDFIKNALYKQGELYMEQGNTETAIQFFKKSIDVDGNNSSSWTALYTIYLSKNDSLNANMAMEHLGKIKRKI